MASMRSSCRAIAALALGGLLCTAGPNLPVAQQRDAGDLAREAYASTLHSYAQGKGGVKQPGYFAIVRRGVDKFNDAIKQVAPESAAAAIALDAIDATPADMDRDPRAQLITSVRLGIRPDASTRVVGGWAVAKGEFDEAVALTGNHLLCSGIAIDGSTVLTAAHCACHLGLAVSSPQHDDEKQVYVGISVGAGSKKFPVKLNETKFLSRDLHGLDPCLNIFGSLAAGNPDLALVRVAGPPMNVPVVRIATPQLMDAAIGTSAFYVYGFGCTKPVQPDGPFKRCDSDSTGVKMTGFISFSATCTDSGACVPGQREFALKDFGNGPLIDTCAGDSGGPVIIIEKETNVLRYHLVGITSRPLNPNGNCGEGGIYAKVGTKEVIDWLKTHVNVQH